MDRTTDIAIVGAGIVGLAHAYMALKKGYRVVLFERDRYATGASIRNFGLLWPIGQAPGKGLDRALRSRRHWIEISEQAGIWCNQNGSLHLAYHDEDWAVLQEFVSLCNEAPYECRLVSPEIIKGISPKAKPENLIGGLFSTTEGTVYSREAIRKIPLWLEERFGLILRFGHAVNEIAIPRIRTSREVWNANKVIICTGADFETLYPEVYEQQPVTKCKLQMLKAIPEKPFKLGPSLCAGLTLRHYPAFAECPSLVRVDARYDDDNENFKKNGIHVLLAQNNYGELIIGDSHHYSDNPEPFDQEQVTELILEYLTSFVDLGKFRITERWNGVYPKVHGNSDLIVEPETNVIIVNGLGGAGMTLSFGLAEEVIERL